MDDQLFEILSVDQLAANYGIVSRNKCGIFLCRQGHGDVLLNNHSYRIEKDFLCIYTPYTFIHIQDRSSDMEGCVLESDLDIFYSTLSNVPVMDRLFIRSHPCIRLMPSQCRRIEQSMEMLVSRHGLMGQAAGNGKSEKFMRLLVQTLIQSLCLEVLEIYFNSFPVDELLQNREEKIFNTFLMSVHRNCARERSVVFYADEQHLSPNYLSSVIKARSGRTAIQWIEMITMVQAQHYLGSSALSIKEIAERLSFPDQSTFGRYFKKYCGKSPTEYRKQMGGEG